MAAGELLRHTVAAAEAGHSLRWLLRQRLGLSRGLLSRLKAAGGISVNGQGQWVDYRLQSGDQVRLSLPESPSAGIIAEPLPLQVVFEDADLLVLDKPPGQLVHPVRWEQTGTLANAVAWRWAQQGVSAPVRPLHRLDRDTSGLVLFACDPWVYGGLLQQLDKGHLGREYRALVRGALPGAGGTVAAPIDRVAGSRVLHTVAPGGKPAVTHYCVLQRWPGASLLALRLETGRTHQIRVHMAHLGHPVLGDKLYATAGPDPDLPVARQMLHAACLELTHPRTGVLLKLESPLPADYRATMAALGAPLQQP